jgi:hypothetical protein
MFHVVLRVRSNLLVGIAPRWASETQGRLGAFVAITEPAMTMTLLDSPRGSESLLGLLVRPKPKSSSSLDGGRGLWTAKEHSSIPRTVRRSSAPRFNVFSSASHCYLRSEQQLHRVFSGFFRNGFPRCRMRFLRQRKEAPKVTIFCLSICSASFAPPAYRISIRMSRCTLIEATSGVVRPISKKRLMASRRRP